MTGSGRQQVFFEVNGNSVAVAPSSSRLPSYPHLKLRWTHPDPAAASEDPGWMEEWKDGWMMDGEGEGEVWASMFTCSVVHSSDALSLSLSVCMYISPARSLSLSAAL